MISGLVLTALVKIMAALSTFRPIQTKIKTAPIQAIQLVKDYRVGGAPSGKVDCTPLTKGFVGSRTRPCLPVFQSRHFI
ncbi:hypothetical protein R3P38DRAFT_2976379 [Favolaschia claudopus]|uniref:Secreted protein n=1 Tax=Favolaschia claudopus TaxID=2862362 RepID=A0AAW0B245_9AGAR